MHLITGDDAFSPFLLKCESSEHLLLFLRIMLALQTGSEWKSKSFHFIAFTLFLQIWLPVRSFAAWKRRRKFASWCVLSIKKKVFFLIFSCALISRRVKLKDKCLLVDSLFKRSRKLHKCHCYGVSLGHQVIKWPQHVSKGQLRETTYRFPVSLKKKQKKKKKKKKRSRRIIF